MKKKIEDFKRVTLKLREEIVKEREEYQIKENKDKDEIKNLRETANSLQRELAKATSKEEENRNIIEIMQKQLETEINKKTEEKELNEEKLTNLEIELVKYKDEIEILEKSEKDNAEQWESLIKGLDKELKETEQKLQIEVHTKEEKARELREIKMKIIKNKEDNEGNDKNEKVILEKQLEVKDKKIAEIQEQLNAIQIQNELYIEKYSEAYKRIEDKDKKIKDLEKEISENNKATQSKESHSNWNISRLSAENLTISEKNRELEKEKEQIENEKIKLKNEKEELIKEKSALAIGIEKERELTKKIAEKIRTIKIKRDEDENNLLTYQENEKEQIKELEKMKAHLGHLEETMMINDNARRRLENMLKERETEIEKLREREKKMTKFYKGERQMEDNDIIPKDSTQEKHLIEKEQREKIKKGGYEVCYYYLKGRCYKLGDCKYIHPPTCKETNCSEECWKVHYSDLEIEDERWIKRGAVPYKLEIPSRAGWRPTCRFFTTVGGCSKGDKCSFRHINEQPLRRPNLNTTKDIESERDLRKQKDKENDENIKKAENEQKKMTRKSTEDLQTLLNELNEIDKSLNFPKN